MLSLHPKRKKSFLFYQKPLFSVTKKINHQLRSLLILTHYNCTNIHFIVAIGIEARLFQCFVTFEDDYSFMQEFSNPFLVIFKSFTTAGFLSLMIVLIEQRFCLSSIDLLERSSLDSYHHSKVYMPLHYTPKPHLSHNL